MKNKNREEDDGVALADRRKLFCAEAAILATMHSGTKSAIMKGVEPTTMLFSNDSDVFIDKMLEIFEAQKIPHAEVDPDGDSDQVTSVIYDRCDMAVILTSFASDQCYSMTILYRMDAMPGAMLELAENFIQEMGERLTATAAHKAMVMREGRPAETLLETLGKARRESATKFEGGRGKN